MATIILEDFYSILQIPQSASLETIRESYKKLALKYHPDKNRSPNATKEFQGLVRAWECLKDEKKRREYDANYWVVKIGLGVGVNVGSSAAASSSYSSGGKRKWNWEGQYGEEGMRWDDTAREEEAERARRRREDVDRDASAQFRSEGSSTSYHEARGKARAWKVMARTDYLSRLTKWEEKRSEDLAAVLKCEKEIKKFEADLEKQMRETDQQITKRFYEAAAKSRAAGAVVKDEHIILKKLLEGRKAYAAKLVQAILKTQTRKEGLISSMQKDWKQYEAEEAKARQDRIQEALGILGPRDSKSPLFSMIDRRGQAINFWKALSRVKAAVDDPDPIKHAKEGPWHLEGTWKRVVGEQTCGRCQQTSFQLIAECAAAECPGCGMIACYACSRDLMLLREYSEWLSAGGREMEDSLFELEFDTCDRAREFDDTSGFNYFGFAHI